MGVSRDTYKTSWDLHAWVGVIVGLFSVIMFGTGAAVVFHADIETWQDPYAQKAAPEPNYERWTDLAVKTFEAKPPRQFTLWMPEGERGYPRVGYFSTETGRYRMEWIDPVRGELSPQTEKLGTLLYHVHTLYDIRWTFLYDLAGLFALVLLLIIVTGMIIQWDTLVAQFQQFRPGRGAFVRWNDLHKVIGVSTLPFQLFYAYSAALIVLGPFFVDAVTGPVFEGDRGAARNATYGRLPRPAADEKGPQAGPFRSIDELVANAKNAASGLEVTKIMYRNWQRPNARIDIEGGMPGDRFGHAIVRLDPTNGEVVRVASPSEQTWAAELRGWLAEVHSVHFGGFAIKLLFALISLACAGSMLAGMVVWFARRRRQREAMVDHLLERLTAGVGTGVVVATACVFAASRLYPWEMPGRLGTEEWTFYLAFLACVVAAFVATHIKRFWQMQLTVAGVLFGVTPLLAARHSTAGLVGVVTSGTDAIIPSVVGVDLGLIGVATALLACVWALGERAGEIEEAS